LPAYQRSRTVGMSVGNLWCTLNALDRKASKSAETSDSRRRRLSTVDCRWPIADRRQP